MSKKPAQKPAKTAQKGKKDTFPQCVNNKQARMVCLSEDCESYPFFCSNCEDSSCEISHQHDDDRLVSVSYKEFTKRVLRQRKPVDALSDAIISYRQILEKLKQNVTEFIEKQLATLEEMQSKSGEMDPEDEQLIEKMKNQKYKELTGAMMDKLWRSSADDPEKKKAQQETAEFMKIKEEEVKGISEHFQHLNKLTIDSPPPKEQEEKPAPANSTSKTKNEKK